MYYVQNKLNNEVAESSAELAQDSTRKVVYGVSFALFMVWMFAGMTISSDQYGEYFGLMLLLLPLAATVLLWLPYRLLFAQVLWLAGLAFIILAAQVFFPGYIFVDFLLPLSFMACILISWRAGVLVEAIVLGELAFFNQLQILPILSEQSLEIVLVSALLGFLGWASIGSFISVTGWASFYARQAKNALDGARQNQVDLFQTQEDLLTANQELSRLLERQKALQQIADEARQVKSEFVSNVSHELRAPLNMIIGFTELISRSTLSYGVPLPGPLLADIATIQRNAQHLSRLVDDVLDLSQIESNRMALTRERSSVYQIVETAVDVVRPLFSSKGLYLKQVLPEGLPTAFCDQTRIRQILINLLANAGRFTQQGGVEVKVELVGSEIIFHVSDTGPGIAKEQQARLFEPFQQIDASIRREHTGSGLGLSISKRFVEMHGGKIWMESEAGSGTTISFSLPLTDAADSNLAPVSGAKRWVNEYAIRDRRTRPFNLDLSHPLPNYILVESGNTLKRFFSRYTENVVVTAFSELDEAIQELARSPAQTLIVNNPDHLSPDEARQIDEKLAALPYETPAIICHLPGKEDTTQEMGVVDYIIKPVNMDNLLATVQKAGENIKSILVVDDEENALQLFMRILLSAPCGYQVWRATTGAMALDMMRSRKPDLVLLDMVLPDMDGKVVLSEKKADENIRDIPVIVVSSRDPVHESVTTNTLMVKRKDGLSARELVQFIEAISTTLTPHLPSGGPEAPGTQPG